MVCLAISSYSFGATGLIFCRLFIHILEVCLSTGFWFSSNILKMTGSWTLVILFRPSGYRYMVCLAISSYSFGATALIFCRMFIHIMEVCMSTGFWWSGGGIICVSMLKKITPGSLWLKFLNLNYLFIVNCILLLMVSYDLHSCNKTKYIFNMGSSFVMILW
jgi:hypothetical protein